MKKILMIMALLAASPVFAACSITGEACMIKVKPPGTSGLPGVQDKYVPDYVKNMEKPNAMQLRVKQTHDKIHLNPSKEEPLLHESRPPVK